jgi:multicomponent Na+:H+ antiporter subunit D
MTTTPGGLLLVLAVLVPFVGVLAGLVLGGRNPQRIALFTLVAGLGLALAVADTYLRSGSALVYLLGGWSPPLGVALRADSLSVMMLVAVAVVICGIGVYACADFGTPEGQREARAPFSFWLLLLAVWGSLNLVFVSGDLFTLYVALELLTFAGVPLVCLDGRGETLRAALRYLLFALLGSVFYLLGAVLLFGACGTLDISLLAARLRPEPVVWTAAALMTAGLLAKTALFPLHLWLPPAHAGAPAAASAVLSALVIKGSWFLVVRLWFDVLPGLVTFSAAQLLGGLGAVAIALFSVVALRQQRLKLLIAYSTLAQIGYLFLMFPLAFDVAAGQLVRGDALTAGMLQAISHATAKAAMFMAAGSIYAALGHDRITGMAGIARALPIAMLALALGGVALMGVLPSGAYLAKKLLMSAADGSGQWWWAWVLLAGGALTSSYVVLVIARAFQHPAQPVQLARQVSRVAQSAALALAVCSLLLACATLGPLPATLIANPLAPKELAALLVTVGCGGALAWALCVRAAGATDVNPVERLALALGGAFERSDSVLRRWPVAGIALLAVAGGFGWALRG